MAGDLERFLQEAAERLARKVEQRKPQRQPPRPQPIREAERRRVDPQVLDAEIVEDEVTPPPKVTRRQKRDTNPLSELDTRSVFGHVVDQADERMAEHIHEVFDHLSDDNLLKSSRAGGDVGRHSQSQASSQVSRRQRDVHPLVDMLRNSESLRTAFIASQIFKRKF